MPQGCHEKRQDLVLDNIPLLSFMKRCGENFREILGGRKDPRQVMFPGGNPDAVESIYQDTPQSRYYNGIMARSLKALADALPMDRALSIMEIGAGTGDLIQGILQRGSKRPGRRCGSGGSRQRRRNRYGGCVRCVGHGRRDGRRLLNGHRLCGG